MSSIYHMIANGWNSWNTSVEKTAKSATTALVKMLPDRFQKVVERHWLTQTEILTHSLAMTLLFHVATIPIICSPITWTIAGVCALATSVPLVKNIEKHARKISTEFQRGDCIFAIAAPIILGSASAFGISYLGGKAAVTAAVVISGTLALHACMIYHYHCKQENEKAYYEQVNLIRQDITLLEEKILLFDTFIQKYPSLFAKWKEIMKTSELPTLDKKPIKNLLNYDLRGQLILIRGRLEHRLDLRKSEVRLGAKGIWEIFVHFVKKEYRGVEPLSIEGLS